MNTKAANTIHLKNRITVINKLKNKLESQNNEQKILGFLKDSLYKDSHNIIFPDPQLQMDFLSLENHIKNKVHSDKQRSELITAIAILLKMQIEILWYKDQFRYNTAHDIEADTSLIDLSILHKSIKFLFNIKAEKTGFLSRRADASLK